MKRFLEAKLGDEHTICSTTLHFRREAITPFLPIKMSYWGGLEADLDPGKVENAREEGSSSFGHG